MNELICNFGEDGASLLGIYTKAESPCIAAKNPTVVLWNFGVAHRVGPHRQFVDLTRYLARYHFNSLRFDLGGLGDSTPATSGRGRHEQEQCDIVAALNHLEATYGDKEFVLVGFCSGTRTAHPVALKDNRVTGLVMVDGYGYITWQHTLLHLKRRLLAPERWWSRLKRIGKKFVKNAGSGFFLDFPAQQQVETEILAMAARGVKLFYAYSGGVQGYFNHEGQFWHMFPQTRQFAEQITVRRYADCNHLFTYQQNRDVLHHDIVSWMVDQFHRPDVHAGARGETNKLSPSAYAAAS